MVQIARNSAQLPLFKPREMGLTIGKSAEFRITGEHLDNKGLISLPVKTTKPYKTCVGGETSKEATDEAHFPLNVGNQRILEEQTKSSDTADWINYAFQAIAITAKNPTSNTNVLSWQIVPDTVKKVA